MTVPSKTYLKSNTGGWWVGDRHPFRVVLGRVYRGLTGGFLLLRNFSVAISVSPHWKGPSGPFHNIQVELKCFRSSVDFFHKGLGSIRGYFGLNILGKLNTFV